MLGARCSSVVRAFAHGAMGHRIDPSRAGPIELFLVPARKEGNVYLTTHSTHFIYGYMREREMFYLSMHSTHCIYGYMASDIWLRTILIEREETCCRNMGYSFRLTARVILYALSHIQDNTYHSLCYTSRGPLAGREIAQWVHSTKDRSNDPSHHERTLLPRSYISLLG